MNKLLVVTCFVFVLLSTSTAAAQTVSVSPSTLDRLCPSDTFKVNINFDSGDENLRGMSLDLDYDETAFKVVDVTEELDNNWLYEPKLSELDGDTDNDGVLHFGAGKTGNFVPASGTLVTVEFRVNDNAEDGDYSLGFQEVSLKNENKAEIQLNTENADVSIDCESSSQSSSGGSSSGGGGSADIATTATPTATPTSTATASPTASVTQTVTATATEAVTTTPVPGSTTSDSSVERATTAESTETPVSSNEASPGFEAVMVIAVLMGAYLISRNK
ncbi:MAG: cohesin domain-containing protein [Archaeoglobaceae archaeon]